jgi:hypothetical protein
MSHGVRPGCAVVHVEPGGAVVVVVDVVVVDVVVVDVVVVDVVDVVLDVVVVGEVVVVGLVVVVVGLVVVVVGLVVVVVGLVVVVGGPLTPPRACGRSALGLSTWTAWQRANGPATGPQAWRVSTSGGGP